MYKFISLAVLNLIFISNSLGLGTSDLQLFSKLGEPLQARLKIIHNDNVDSHQILVSQASPSAYKSMKIERVSSHQDLRFTLERLNNQIYILLSTDKSIVEPYFHVLLNIRWPKGEIFKEIKILIDPIPANQ